MKMQIFENETTQQFTTSGHYDIGKIENESGQLIWTTSTDEHGENLTFELSIHGTIETEHQHQTVNFSLNENIISHPSNPFLNSLYIHFTEEILPYFGIENESPYPNRKYSYHTWRKLHYPEMG